MTLETFFDKFDQFADAPDAVAKMRELVVQWSIRGKLLPQRQSEDSKVLLELAKKAKVKAQGSKSKAWLSNDALVPFGIPNNWTCLCVGDAIEMINGRAFKSTEWAESGVPIVRIQNLNNPQASFNYFKGDFDERHRIDNGTFLISWSGTPGTSFGAFIWERGEALLNQHIFKCVRFGSEITADYLKLAINARLDEMISHAQGGVGLRHITKGKLESIALPLPPLAEQKRIVAKVDELMALCDRLEAQQQERDTRHAALARASLARFAEAPTPANLHHLFHPSYTIPPADLRKSILTLAVQGKLVPQDPNDEPAEELIERLGELRNAAKAKAYDDVSPNEAPYDIPGSWKWVRLGNICLSSDSGWSPQCSPEQRAGTEWGVLKVSAVSWGTFNPEENKALPPGRDPRPGCEVKPGDFLLSRANTEELVARSVVVVETPPHLMMSDKIVRFTFPDGIERDYINLANSSGPARTHYVKNSSGTSSSMKNVGRGVMCALPIPLPPLAEQRRIVAKVNELMVLCDKLENFLTRTHAKSSQLLKAMVAEISNT